MKIKNLALACLVFLALPAMAAQCYPDAVQAYSQLKRHQTHHQKKSARININTATASDFLSLQGIGVRTAEAIVAYRVKFGKFASVDDLRQVKGINTATIKKNKHRLVVAD